MSNLAGQRITMVDPNAGTTTTTYDADGKTASVTSPAGRLDMSYDVVGRLTGRTSHEGSNGTGPVSSSATWDYVNAGETGALGAQSGWADFGLLRGSTSTTVVSGVPYLTSTTATYDVYHRPSTSTVTLPVEPLLGDLSGTSYTTEVRYDTNKLGQVASTLLPAVGGLPAETVSVGYRLSGVAQTLSVAPTDVSGVVTNLVTGVTLDGTGQLTDRFYGNGVLRHVVWDPQRRVPTSLVASFDVDGTGPVLPTKVQEDTLKRPGFDAASF